MNIGVGIRLKFVRLVCNANGQFKCARLSKMGHYNQPIMHAIFTTETC